MQESKYYYKGIPLTKYCKDNNININTIRSRIFKKKHNIKYKNYTEQEIINLTIETYGSAIKYMYQGITLRQYCLNNNINIGTITSRIENLRKKNNNLSDDELVILALEKYNNQNFRFFYKGIHLKQYCENNPPLNYNTIRTYINREQEKNPQLSDEELIEQYINKEHKGIYKYYYLGIPLKQYCDENNLNYKNIILHINRHKNNANFKNLTNDEFIEIIMDKYQPFNPKYIYKEVTLRQYCLKNNLSYYSVVSFVKRKIENGSNKNIDELIDEGIKTINRYGIIYYYKGIPLKDYAKENDLNIGSIRSIILKKRLKSNKPLQEIINECVETYQKFTLKYYYNNIPLTQYCNSINLNYNTVIQKYLYEYKDSNIEVNDAIKEIIDHYIKYPPIKTKYYFNNQSLANFCNINNYSYQAIYRKIKQLESKDNLLDTEKIIQIVIDKYEERLEINKINETFNKLNNQEINNINEIEDICNFLKIDFENVNDLVSMNFSYNQAINMIWYFSDKKLNNDYKIITDTKIKDIFLLIDNLKNSNINIENYQLYDLIAIYKSELYDSRIEILERQNKYIYKVLNSLCKSYNITINNNNYEDFISEIKYYLLLVINKINLNIPGKIIKYMDLTIKGNFKNYLKNYQKQNISLSLNDAEYRNDKNIKSAKSKLEYITDPKNLGEEPKKSSFSLEMMKVLSLLPPQDLLFITLKYQDNYTNKDLANYFNLTLEEINQKEIDILSLLKNNNKVKALKKLK